MTFYIKSNWFVVLILTILPCVSAKALTPSVLGKTTLKVLDIGNSYSVDATTLLPLIAKASHSDLSTICLYRCYRGSVSFKNWVDVYNDQDKTKNYTIKKILGDLPANVKTGTGEAGDGKLFRDVLTDEKWDLIIIHQVSTYAPYYSMWKSYNSAGYLDELISVIKKHQPDAELGFLLVHSYWGAIIGMQRTLRLTDGSR